MIKNLICTKSAEVVPLPIFVYIVFYKIKAYISSDVCSTLEIRGAAPAR